MRKGIYDTPGARWSQCESKARFTTEEYAERTGKRHVPMQRAYHCQWCDGFHLTRSEPRQVKNRATTHPDEVIARAERAVAELVKKKVTGPLLDTAVQTLEGLQKERAERLEQASHPRKRRKKR